MRTKHIAFFPFPHTPHIHPTLSIVSTLVRRGHRVTCVTSDSFSPKAATLGAEILSCPRFVEFSVDGKAQFRDGLTLSATVISDVAPFYEESRPDLILYDRAFFAGRVLANRWNIPAITTSAGLAFNKADISQLSDLCREWREVEIQSTKVVDSFFDRYGIHEKGSYFHEENLNIYLYPKLYQLAGDVFSERYFYAGRCAAERPYHGAWRPSNTGGRPIVLVSTSTAYVPGPEYFKMCIDALSELRWHILLVLGGNFDPTILGRLPAHCEIVQHVTQIQMLPHLNLLVCMGGPISAAESMYHGVPLLMITQGVRDLEAYAENAARLGIGIHLRKAETTAETIRDSALRILDDITIAGRVKELQQIVKREPGAEETANRIEDYLRDTID